MVEVNKKTVGLSATGIVGIGSVSLIILLAMFAIYWCPDKPELGLMKCDRLSDSGITCYNATPVLFNESLEEYYIGEPLGKAKRCSGGWKRVYNDIIKKVVLDLNSTEDDPCVAIINEEMN